MEGGRISLKEASHMTGYHPDYISSLIRRGQIRGEKIGRNWFTTKREIDVYMSKKKYVPMSFLFSKKLIAGVVSCIVIIAISVFLLNGNSTPEKSLVRQGSDENEPLIVTE